MEAMAPVAEQAAKAALAKGSARSFTQPATAGATSGKRGISIGKRVPSAATIW
jgi:hypothetical protein